MWYGEMNFRVEGLLAALFHHECFIPFCLLEANFLSIKLMCVCVCVCVRVRACVRACIRLWGCHVAVVVVEGS